MKKIIFTIVSNNYLGSALSLYDSVTNHCSKDIDFACLISDEKNKKINYDDLDFYIIWPGDFLEKRLLNEMAFKYNVVEYNTALKPFAIDYLMNKLEYDRVFYFDPDTYLFDSINSIELNLENKDIVLTPHIVEGINQAEFKEDEEAILRNGIYNLGFIGLNKSSESEKIIAWWKCKLINQCYDDKSYFVDQKWLNFITAFSESVCILRKKIYNVAKWNYHEREIEIIDGKYFIEGERLCFFHFSGYKAGDIDRFIEQEFIYSEYKDVLHELFKEYQEELISNHFEEYRKIPYCYNNYSNGMAITKLNRRLYRQLLENGVNYGNPFEVGDNSFYSLMKVNGLLSGVYNTDELKAAIAKKHDKDKMRKLLNSFMRILKRLIGVKKYELLLNYFYSYCTIDNQIFLINKKNIKNKHIKGFE